MHKLSYTVLFICFSLFTSIVNAQVNAIQNIQGRKIQSLNGKWNYIVDPYENGYYDYRMNLSINLKAALADILMIGCKKIKQN